MSITRFPARADGPADRMAGFVAHLRQNGFGLGAQATGDALAALSAVDATDPATARRALAPALATDAETWRRFDDLFDAYWFNTGLTRSGTESSPHLRVQSARPKLWQPHLDPATGAGGETGDAATPDDGTEAAEGSDGRLIATRTDNLSRRDLRELMTEDDLRRAAAAAEALARAMRDRRSRRRRQASRGDALDMRRILRTSLARGGEPIDLHRRTRPPRPLRIVALCDVSGSMTVYARVFLSFLKGLVDSGTRADAYLFHTRLMRVTEALRDRDTLRAAGRLSLMAEGFGGGTDISGALGTFLDRHAARALDRRTVVVILSDGYCTGTPEALGTELARLRRKVRRIVWLNPLKGWAGYAPVAAAIRAAEPHLDAHLPANTLDALAALEPQFKDL